MRSLQHLLSSDRRAARLLGKSERAEILASSSISGLEALGLVVAVYGAERLTGHGEKRVSDRALRASARRLVEEARMQDDVRAERLLIGLRGPWLQLPAVRRVSDPPARRALWDRLVRICCEEFYAPRGAPERHGTVA